MPRVAVIGAGIAGLTVLKSLLEEGLDAVAFDANSDIGGIWAYRDQPGGHPTVMNCTIMNSSKELSAFSDFPPPASIPNFMHHTSCKRYLDLYAEHFGLLKSIRLNHLVESVRPTPDHEKTGAWEVVVLDMKSNTRESSVFSAVVVCSGKHSTPRLPRFPGQDRFKGRILHSTEYKTPENFKGKKILVVGIGNSASDMAVEISGVAEKVYLSSRSGAWLFGRLGKGGKPADLALFTRFKLFLQRVLPYDWVCSYVENLLSLRMDHTFYKLRPAHRALSHYPTITDDLPYKIATGQVLIKPDVESFQEDSVKFKGEVGDRVKIDDVIMATGFIDNFPFLDPVQWPVKDGLMDLFLHTFPPESIHPTLAFLGMVYAFGPQAPAMEMQGRWIARVFSGKCRLPSSTSMRREVEEDHRRFAQRFGADSLLNGQADWLPLIDQMAGYIGVHPRMWRLLLTDPVLFYHCLFGPSLAYIYRLHGPHAWPGARDAILHLHDRIAGISQAIQEPDKKEI